MSEEVSRVVTTYSSIEVAEQIGCSDRYIQDQIRARRFRARKIGRSWRFTEDDVQFALDAVCNRVAPVAPIVTESASTGLTPTSRRKLLG